MLNRKNNIQFVKVFGYSGGGGGGVGGEANNKKGPPGWNWDASGQKERVSTSMNYKDFCTMANEITNTLGGKKVSHATAHEWEMSFAIRLYFKDGTSVLIHPEHDEGFYFNFDCEY